MARLAPLDLDTMTPDQRRVADEIRGGPRGGMRGPFEAWLRSPGLADHAQKLGAHVRFGTELPKDVAELVILLTGAHWQAQFEFWAHARLGRSVGLPEDATMPDRVKPLSVPLTKRLLNSDMSRSNTSIRVFVPSTSLKMSTLEPPV